jgi:hypothetical protein
MAPRLKSTKKRSPVVTLAIDADQIVTAIIERLADWIDQQRPAKVAAPPPLLLTLPMLRDRTGFSISYWKKEIREGRLKALQIGDKRAVRPEIFEAWLNTKPAAIAMAIAQAQAQATPPRPPKTAPQPEPPGEAAR